MSEVIVYVGTATCFVYFINELTLRCDLPDEQLSAGDFNGQNTERGLPEVVVSPKTKFSWNNTGETTIIYKDFMGQTKKRGLARLSLSQFDFMILLCWFSLYKLILLLLLINWQFT